MVQGEADKREGRIMNIDIVNLMKMAVITSQATHGQNENNPDVIARAVLSAINESGTHMIVPIEPTEDMLFAKSDEHGAMSVTDESGVYTLCYDDVWQAMLSEMQRDE